MQKIRIDFDNPGLPQHISAVENDSQSRFFQATLYENGKAYTAPEGAAYSIMYRGFGPQNQGWYDTINDGAGKRAACAVSGNVVTCEIARQALQVPGHVSIVLCVTTGKGYMLKSWPIECDCKNDRYDSTAEIQSFFYITQVSNADWTQAIQAVEELKNTIDPTLSLSGKAADAAKVGEAINAEAERAKGMESQIKEDVATEVNRAKRNEESLENKKADKTDLDTERKRIDVLNEGGLNLKDEVIDTSIKEWLTDHPEATTTVQDGAITEGKINAEFLPYIKNGYVTPEMFGAAGDGVKDDTYALQKAIDSGQFVFASKQYKLSSTIKIDVQNSLLLIGNFTYTGTDCAFWIHNSQEANKVVFGRINSNGNCINIVPDTQDDYIQYLNLYFNNLIASTENGNACIYIRSNGRWATETNIFGGRFRKGTYGIYAICDTGEVEHIKVYNCGFELTQYGSHIKDVNAFSIINCRYSENKHILTTVGTCINTNIYSSEDVQLEKLSFSKGTTGFIIGAPVSKSNDYSISKFASIHGGFIYINNVAKYANLHVTENGEVDFSTAFPTARDLPTSINVPVSVKTIILSAQYGKEFGINKIMIAPNETQIRTLTIKKDNNVIAILGKEIPNYSYVILEWFPQYEWSYRIVTMTKRE